MVSSSHRFMCSSSFIILVLLTDSSVIKEQFISSYCFLIIIFFFFLSGLGRELERGNLLLFFSFMGKQGDNLFAKAMGSVMPSLNIVCKIKVIKFSHLL